MKNFPRSLAICIALGVLWLACAIVVNPGGNFPLNDDWNYAVAVKTLLEEGRLKFTGWTLAASLTNILCGAAACKITGFSFETLRWLNLLAGLTGGIACYKILRHFCETPRPVAAAGAACLLFNPLYFSLSYTFMNDVPFLAIALCLSWVFCEQMTKERGPGLVVLACLLSTALCLSRQIGVVVPLAFAVTLLFPSSNRSKSNAITRIAPLVVSLAAIGIFQFLFRDTLSTLFSWRTEQAYLSRELSQGVGHVAVETLLNLLRAVIYLGLFTLPFSISACATLHSVLDRSQKIFYWVLSGEIFLALLALLVSRGSLMPLADNVLLASGLGPILLPYSEFEWPASLPLVIFMTAAGTLGAGLLTANLTSLRLFEKKNKSQGGEVFSKSIDGFFLLVTGLYLTAICTRGFFDRYLIVAVPFFLFAMAGIWRALPREAKPQGRLIPFLSAATLAAYTWFCVVGTHDYLAWNRARWQALNYLTGNCGIPFMEIDGGLEFNGWMSYQKDAPPGAVVFEPSMKHRDNYIVTMGNPKEYRTMASFSCITWFPAGNATLYAMAKKRDDGKN